MMLVCTTCDEPFVPVYPRLCEWCGHEFDHGYDVTQQPVVDPITGRAIAVLIALSALGIGLAAYFVILL
jgi:hypothetical protein